MNGKFLVGVFIVGMVLFCVMVGFVYGVKVEVNMVVQVVFDIIEMMIVIWGDMVVFIICVWGDVGLEKFVVMGKFEGLGVYVYVWLILLNFSEVGFDKDQGIVVLVVMFYLDFDDVVCGGKNCVVWYLYWVVLVFDKVCGGGLKVVDIGEGVKLKVLEIWLGVLLLIDSFDYLMVLKGDMVDVQILFKLILGFVGVKFDGVMVGLKVNVNLYVLLFCVSNVFKVVFGDLRLLGKVMFFKQKDKCGFVDSYC